MEEFREKGYRPVPIACSCPLCDVLPHVLMICFALPQVHCHRQLCGARRGGQGAQRGGCAASPGYFTCSAPAARCMAQKSSSNEWSACLAGRFQDASQEASRSALGSGRDFTGRDVFQVHAERLAALQLLLAAAGA